MGYNFRHKGAMSRFDASEYIIINDNKQEESVIKIRALVPFIDQNGTRFIKNMVVREEYFYKGEETPHRTVVIDKEHGRYTSYDRKTRTLTTHDPYAPRDEFDDRTWFELLFQKNVRKVRR